MCLYAGIEESAASLHISTPEAEPSAEAEPIAATTPTYAPAPQTDASEPRPPDSDVALSQTTAPVEVDADAPPPPVTVTEPSEFCALEQSAGAAQNLDLLSSDAAQGAETQVNQTPAAQGIDRAVHGTGESRSEEGRASAPQVPAEANVPDSAKVCLHNPPPPPPKCSQT